MRFLTILFSFLMVLQMAKAQSWTPYIAIDWLKFYHAYADIELDFRHQSNAQLFSDLNNQTRTDARLDYQKAQLILPELSIGLSYDKQYIICFKPFFAVNSSDAEQDLNHKGAFSYYGVSLKQQLYFEPMPEGSKPYRPYIRPYIYHQIGYNWVKRTEPTYTIRGYNGSLLEVGLGVSVFNFLNAYIGYARWNRTRAQLNPATAQPEFISFPTQNIAWGLSYQYFIPIKTKKR